MPTWDGTPGVGIYTDKYVKTKTTSWLLVHSDSWPSFPETWLFDPAKAPGIGISHFFDHILFLQSLFP